MAQQPEVMWGIRSSPAVGSLAQRFALIAGLIYVVVGLLGFFVTGFDHFTEATGEALFGFELTPFHNIVHLGIGALWLLAALALTRPAAEGANFAIGAFLIVAAVLGYLGYLGFLAVGEGFVPDFWLHLLSGVVTLLFAGVLGTLTGRT